MYGMINQGMRDLVTHHAGEAAWYAVCIAAAVDPEGFEALTEEYHSAGKLESL